MDALPTISHVTLGVEKIELNKLYLFVIFSAYCRNSNARKPAKAIKISSVNHLAARKFFGGIFYIQARYGT